MQLVTQTRQVAPPEPLLEPEAPHPTPNYPPHLSYSQLSTWMDCQERWRLSRVYGLDKTTWYATLAGSAIHEAIHRHIQGRTADPEAEFLNLFTRELDEANAAGIEVKASGPKLVKSSIKGGPNKKDAAWWMEYGPGYVTAALEWLDTLQAEGWTPYTHNGKPASELEFMIQPTAQAKGIRGSIDLVMVNSAGQLMIVDWKTGTSHTSELQLKTYQLGMRATYGLEATYATFWKMGRGTVGYFELKHLDAKRTYGLYRAMTDSIQSGNFTVRPSAGCRACPVSAYCWQTMAPRAALVVES